MHEAGVWRCDTAGCRSHTRTRRPGWLHTAALTLCEACLAERGADVPHLVSRRSAAAPPPIFYEAWRYVCDLSNRARQAEGLPARPYPPRLTAALSTEAALW